MRHAFLKFVTTILTKSLAYVVRYVCKREDGESNLPEPAKDIYEAWTTYRIDNILRGAKRKSQDELEESQRPRGGDKS